MALLNYGFVDGLHRDTGNARPSFIKAMWRFSGGKLEYYPGDDSKVFVDKLKHEQVHSEGWSIVESPVSLPYWKPSINNVICL